MSEFNIPHSDSQSKKNNVDFDEMVSALERDWDLTKWQRTCLRRRIGHKAYDMLAFILERGREAYFTNVWACNTYGISEKTLIDRMAEIEALGLVIIKKGHSSGHASSYIKQPKIIAQLVIEGKMLIGATGKKRIIPLGKKSKTKKNQTLDAMSPGETPAVTAVETPAVTTEKAAKNDKTTGEIPVVFASLCGDHCSFSSPTTGETPVQPLEKLQTKGLRINKPKLNSPEKTQKEAFGVASFAEKQKPGRKHKTVAECSFPSPFKKELEELPF